MNRIVLVIGQIEPVGMQVAMQVANLGPTEVIPVSTGTFARLGDLTTELPESLGPQTHVPPTEMGDSLDERETQVDTWVQQHMGVDRHKVALVVLNPQDNNALSDDERFGPEAPANSRNLHANFPHAVCLVADSVGAYEL